MLQEKLLLIVLNFLLVFPMYGQSYQLDPTFNPNYNFNHFGCGLVARVTLGPNANLYLEGYFWDNDNWIFGVENYARLDYFGNFDENFYMIAPTPFLGKGFFYNDLLWLTQHWDIRAYDQNANWVNMAFNDSLDKDFTGGITSSPYILEDGSMFIGLNKRKYIWDSISDNRYSFAKILPTGRADTSFKHTPDEFVDQIFKSPEDKLVVKGGFSSWDGHPCWRIARIGLNGEFDSSFTSVVEQPTFGILHVQPDSKVLVGGHFTIQGSAQRYGLVRLNADGSLDSTFNNENNVAFEDTFSTPTCNVVCPTPDGGYLFGGVFDSYQGYPRGRIVKVDSNGFIDTTVFNHEGFDTLVNWFLPYFGHYVSVEDIIPALEPNTYFVAGRFAKYNGIDVQPIVKLKYVPLGLGEVQKQPYLNLYPNPAKEYVQMETDLTGNLEVTILNMQGGLIRQEHLINRQLDISYLKNGIYLLEIESTNQRVIRKLMIQK